MVIQINVQFFGCLSGVRGKLAVADYYCEGAIVELFRGKCFLNSFVAYFRLVVFALNSHSNFSIGYKDIQTVIAAALSYLGVGSILHKLPSDKMLIFVPGQ